MAVTSKTSFMLSSIITVLLFSGMQMYKSWLISSKLHIIFGGFLGSLIFLFLLTALGNLETILFGKSFQLKLPEVCFAMFVSLLGCGLVHRVATTTCFLFSTVTLYYVNRISQDTYSIPAPTVHVHTKKKK